MCDCLATCACSLTGLLFPRAGPVVGRSCKEYCTRDTSRGMDWGIWRRLVRKKWAHGCFALSLLSLHITDVTTRAFVSACASVFQLPHFFHFFHCFFVVVVVWREAPNGLIIDWWGPGPGRHQDNWLVHQSDLRRRLRSLFNLCGPMALTLRCYGDLIFARNGEISRGER